MKNKNLKKIELLCPAGDLDRLKTAVVFGADAVYCGLSDFSLRSARELNFTLETLREGIEFAHARNAKVYLTFNIFPHEWMMKDLEKEILNIKNSILNIDGFIVADLGMFSLIKKHFPDIPIHVSTQANTLNIEAIKMWGELGAERIVLARELTLGEIREISKKLKAKSYKLELEVFGHGAMCMAYSGRCLLSKYFTGREANLGECAQPCRWRYKIKSQKSNLKNQNYGVPSGQIFIEEETRPGDLLEIQEDPNGTYFMNSKDLCVLDILDQFIESGIDSLKIEGRTKSSFYVAVVTYVYRKAIDEYYKLSQISNLKSQKYGVALRQYKKTIKELMDELNQIQNRGYWHGFLIGRHDYQQEYDTAAIRPTVIPVGQVIEIGMHKGSTQEHGANFLMDVMNKFKVGEELEILTPNGIYPIKVKKIIDEKSKELEEILKPKEKVWIEIESRIKNLESKISERSILRRKMK
uniref:U32 family peptidase n=1 Tax=candidate division CPR3 bacterium TaxID=2268181 RepID=A0A7C4LZK4_UNCC3